MPIISIQDDDFGQLVWDSELHEWVGRAIFVDGVVVELRIETPAVREGDRFADEESGKTITGESRVGFARLREIEPAVRARAAEDWAGHYAEWNDGTITPAGFHERLRLNAVRVLPDGRAEVYYEDGGMFNGNALIAHLGHDGAVKRVEMSG